MDLNNTFNYHRFQEYAAYLKQSGLSDTSLKRKISSLSSFQKFLLKRKIVSTKSTPISSPDILTSLRSIFPFKKKTN